MDESETGKILKREEQKHGGVFRVKVEGGVEGIVTPVDPLLKQSAVW